MTSYVLTSGQGYKSLVVRAASPVVARAGVAMASPLKSPYCQPAKAQSDLWAMGLKSLSPQEKRKKREEEEKAELNAAWQQFV